MDLMNWLRGLTRNQRFEAEMDEEMREHLERLTEHNLTAGMNPAEARRAAHLRFGSKGAIQEAARDQRPFRWLADLRQDAGYALRMLRHIPGFTAAIVLTLALGIGANTAMFSVVDGVLLRPLPYPDSHRLVRVGEVFGDSFETVNYPNYLDWKAQQDVFEEIGLWRLGSRNLIGAGDPVRLTAVEMSADTFRALRVWPLLGRFFAPDEDRPGAPRLAVLSHKLWQSRFGGDPAVLNRTITLADNPYTVIGIMPAGFVFPGELWLAAGPDSASWINRDHRVGHRALARLKDGVSVDQARAAMSTIAARLEHAHPVQNRNVRIGVDPLLRSQVEGVSRTLWILLGAAGLVLLVTCANVAGLLLARAVYRRREMALRAALGARQGRILRQVLTESLLLAAAGAALGVVIAQQTVAAFVAWGSEAGIPRADQVSLDGRVLVFCAAVAAISAILFGLAPAWKASRVDLQETLKGGAGRSPPGRPQLRNGLLVGQVAITMILLAGAGLLLKSLYRLQKVDVGFVDEHVLSFRLGLPQRKYPSPESRLAFFDSLLSRLRALPGVGVASIGSQVPLDSHSWQVSFSPDNQPEPPPHQRPGVEVHFIEGDYFRALGIPLLRGRSFTVADDVRHLERVDPKDRPALRLTAVVIDDVSARRYWPDQDPVGQRIRMPWGRPTVVGVVGRVKREDLKFEPLPRLQAYFSHRQIGSNDMTVLMKTAGDPGALVATARAELQAIDPHQPMAEVGSLERLRDRKLGPGRLSAVLVGTFAGLALLLALLGLYGVLAYSVAQRQREIGVRVALGAHRRQVVALVVRQGLALAGLGVALGLCGALAVSRTLSTLLFEVNPHDPQTLAVASALVCVVALFAAYLPARKAAALDPMRALRND